eukprot:gene4867-5335_t
MVGFVWLLLVTIASKGIKVSAWAQFRTSVRHLQTRVSLSANRLLSMSAIVHTPRVLSIQSHTVYGYVGNKAATFPLQTMGFNVDCINTVSLSNHPAYEKGTKGRALEEEVFADIIEGLEMNQLMNYDLILTGYTRSRQHLEIVASTVRKVRVANPTAAYLCDPVLGDNGQFYVPADLLDVYKDSLLPLATIITPNMFESQVLSGVTITTLDDALLAASRLHALGPDIVIMTGLSLTSNPENHLTAIISAKSSHSLRKFSPSSSLLHSANDDDCSQIAYAVSIPRLEGYYAGCGDLCSSMAVASFHVLREELASCPALLGDILEVVINSMKQVMSITALRGSRELSIIESRDIFVEASLKLRRLSYHRHEHDLRNHGQSLQSFLIRGHRPPLGLIFDMDGTLTEPGAIDFAAMYSRIGIERVEKMDILSLVQNLSSEEAKQQALTIIYEEEMKGCERQVLRGHFHKLMTLIARNKVRTAICTRNCLDAVQHFVAKTEVDSALFNPIYHRDSLGGINKPDPRVVLSILSQWRISEENRNQIWFVGDSLDDMICAKKAGCRSILVKAGDNQHLKNKHPELIDEEVEDLEHLIQLLGL